MSDPISDMITRLKNAQCSQLTSIDLPYSVHKVKILKVLKDEGYILEYLVHDERVGVKTISIKLKYSKVGKPAITVIQRVSTPGRRFYTSFNNLKAFFNGLGIQILSTSSRGVISDKLARKYKIGGEIICKVF